MRLITSNASPFVRKCRVMIREAGRLADIEEFPVNTSALKTDPVVAAANPLGKIPALLPDDGPAIYDSRIITRYLDARFASGFYPEDRLWRVLTLEATGDGIMDSAASMTYEVRLRPENERSPGWIEAQWAKIARTLDALEAEWMAHLAGPVDMGQIALGCALGYLDLRHDARGWREGHPALAAWHAPFAERPSMVQTRAE